MKRKPAKGEPLLLLAWAQKSRKGFSVRVECISAHDRDDALMGKTPAAKCLVTVLMPCGQLVEVTRADLEPASDG